MQRYLRSLAVLAILFGGTSALLAQPGRSAEVQRFEAAVRDAEARQALNNPGPQVPGLLTEVQGFRATLQQAEARLAQELTGLTPEQQAALQVRLLMAQGRLVMAAPQGNGTMSGIRYSSFGQSSAGAFTQPVFQQGSYNQATLQGSGFNQPAFQGSGFNQPTFQGTGFNQPAFQGTGFNQNLAQNFNQIPGISGNFLPPSGFFGSVGYVETTMGSNGFGRPGPGWTQPANTFGQFRPAQGNFHFPAVTTQGLAGHFGSGHLSGGHTNTGHCAPHTGTHAATQFTGNHGGTVTRHR